MLVRVTDEEGRDWNVYEIDPKVDRTKQSIECKYRFELSIQTGGPLNTTQTLVHHYSLPEQLVPMLEEKNFEIQSISGDFFASKFDARDSQHVVIVARKPPSKKRKRSSRNRRPKEKSKSGFGT